MKKSDKALAIQELQEKFQNSTYFYVADSSGLSVETINKFRRVCFEKGIEVKVVKNTLAIKAMESCTDDKNFEDLKAIMKGPSTILFSEVGNLPARIIKDFRKKAEKPAIKAAYIDAGIFVGDDQIEALTQIKSKEELLGEIITLLQSPASNVISALQSGGSTLAGIVKTLEEKASN